MTRIGRMRVMALIDRDAWLGDTVSPHAVERHVVASLQRQARHLSVIRFTTAAALKQALDREKPDVVFNMTDRPGGSWDNDGHLCALLEMYGVPYTGAGPKGMMLCRDKAVSKMVAAGHGFRMPWFFVVNGAVPDDVRFPLVVKPRLADASDGMSQRSLVANRGELLRRIAALRRQKFHDIICEEYIRGREMVVGTYLGRVLGARELIVGRNGDGAPRIFTGRLKRDAAYRRRWSVRIDAARLTKPQQRALAEAVQRTTEVLCLRDYARFDFKLDAGGSFVFMEANPNPPLTPGEHSFAGTWAGTDFDSVVAQITCAAARRGRT